MTGRVGTETPARWVFAAAGFVLVCLSCPMVIEGQQQATMLDTVRVQAVSRIDPSMPASTRTVELITADQIASLPVHTVAEVLNWATGVDVLSRSPAQADVSIRGAGFEQVVVLVNGVRMSDPQTGHFDLDLVVPLESVERVEVIRGAASSLYGADAMGGVINVVTRSSETAFAGSVQGGSWNTVRMSVRGGKGGGGDGGGLTLNFGGEAARSDGHRDGTDYESLLVHSSVSHRFAGGRVAGELGAARRDFGAQEFYAPFPSFERTRTYTASVVWQCQGSHPLEWEMRLSARRHDDDFVLVRDDPSVYRNQHTSSQGGGSLLSRYSANGAFAVAIGGEFFWDDLSSSNLGNHTERRGAVFVETLLGGVGTAALSLGARADWHQGFGAVVSPSLSASAIPHHTMRIRAGFGRSFRAPTWTERYYRDPVNVGGSDLKPERAWSGELGYDLSLSESLGISTTVFLRSATSLIDWARRDDALANDPWEARNVEDAMFKGIEANLEFRGPLALRWTVGGTALTVSAEDAIGFRSKYALRPLTEQLTIGAERNIGTAATIGVRVRHGRREAEDAFQRMDLRLSAWVAAGWLRLDLQNLTDSYYRDVTGAPAPGRAVFLGFSMAPK